MSFTFFNKFGDIMNLIEDEEDKKLFAYAIATYGISGELIDLPYPLNAMFEGCREDIENSVRSRECNTGGRPKIARANDDTDQDFARAEEKVARANDSEIARAESNQIARANTDVARAKNTNTEEKGVIDFEKPPVIENEKPKPNQTNPDQAKPNQASMREVRTKFSPPTPAQVREYATEKGLSIDPDRFCDYFAAQGWRISNGCPMKDWKAAARNWAAREGPTPRYRGKLEQGQEVTNAIDYSAYCGF
jgi:hypothetical protein